MNRCRDCRFTSTRTGVEWAPDSAAGLMRCSRIIPAKQSHDLSGHMAIVIGSWDEYDDALLVRPEFGCVLWEKKE